MAEEQQPHEDVKWYTPAKRIPQFIGKPPGGGHYPGGPYTVVQVVGAAVVLIAGLKTIEAWGRWGWFVDHLILVVITASVLFGLRLVKPGGRSVPMAAGAILAGFVGAPNGRHRGRRISPSTPQRVRRGVIHALLDPSPSPSASPAAATTTETTHA